MNYRENNVYLYMRFSLKILVFDNQESIRLHQKQMCIYKTNHFRNHKMMYVNLS
jgi:hypothetical protein